MAGNRVLAQHRYRSRQIQLLLRRGQFVLQPLPPPVQEPPPHAVRLPARHETRGERHHDGDLDRAVGAEVCHVHL